MKRFFQVTFKNRSGALAQHSLLQFDEQMFGPLMTDLDSVLHGVENEEIGQMGEFVGEEVEAAVAQIVGNGQIIGDEVIVIGDEISTGGGNVGGHSSSFASIF